SPKGAGRHCDRFRNRVMFPIFNLYDKVIGFGARALEEKQVPKYLNSSDTPVFNKGKNLYGLNLAKREIISKDRVVVVEGYTDCIRCHENGFKEAVAPLGTALTEWQIRTLKRYTKNVILIFDADQAGETASLRGLDLLVSEGITPKIAAMPAGFDPDKYLLEKGAEEFEKIIKSAPGFFDYKVSLLRSKYKAQEPEGKARIAAELLPTLARVDNAVLKSAYVRKLADILEVKGADVLSELKKIKSVNYSYDKNEVKKVSQGLRVDMAEKILFVLMLEDNSLINVVRNTLRPADFESSGMRKIVELIFNFDEKGKKISPSRLIDAMGGNEAACLISSISVNTPEITDASKNLNDCVKTIKRRNIDKKIKELKAAQRKAQKEKIAERTFKLTVEFAQLVNERKKFARSVK
ncbi:MAG: toprim domain-containing protein, partial [Candidatus Omnitrophica bacterium]|nr:toprim domain-containing protein [Candidatus Omnitrophota bacterium]